MCRAVLFAQLCVERCCWLNCVARGVVGSIVWRKVLLAELCRGVVGSMRGVCREVLLPQLCVERCCCLNCV